MPKVIIGVDPHKRSNTVLVLDTSETVLAAQRFNNDRDGHRELKTFARAWKSRTWAVGGAPGILTIAASLSRHPAQPSRTRMRRRRPGHGRAGPVWRAPGSGGS